MSNWHLKNVRHGALVFNRRQAGFTFIELVITIVLVGIISTIGSLLIMQGTKEYIAQDVRAGLANQGRLGIERMAREIRAIRSRTAADIPVWGAGTLQFTDVTGAAITYTVGAGALTRNGTVLASDVSGLAFSYLQNDGVTAATAATNIWIIQINLTVTRSGETQTLRIRVHPRSFT
ncbi:MAG: prepilin-type N-terminal cleavage/methylation domain-containing protein [Nitrospirae bacterium]|nr:prepilin-type N-terminal cleavage/methylation domain-containing protein [Nitrospirota bacterium]